MFIDLFSRRCNLKSVEFSKQFMHLHTMLNLHYLFCPLTQFVLVSGKRVCRISDFSIVTVFHSDYATFAYFLFLTITFM